MIYKKIAPVIVASAVRVLVDWRAGRAGLKASIRSPGHHPIRVNGKALG
jgi:hypothetical protein